MTSLSVVTGLDDSEPKNKSAALEGAERVPTADGGGATSRVISQAIPKRNMWKLFECYAVVIRVE